MGTSASDLDHHLQGVGHSSAAAEGVLDIPGAEGPPDIPVVVEGPLDIPGPVEGPLDMHGVAEGACLGPRLAEVGPRLAEGQGYQLVDEP